jgi:hypothetical protein
MKYNRNNNTRIILLIIGCCAGLAVMTIALPGSVNAASPKPLTPNMVAANGPLPGNLSLYETEVACSEAQNNPGYYLSLNGAEVADAQRSELYPCAHFTGSFTHPSQNVVYAWRSQDNYQGASFINNRNPGELFLVGGDNPNATGPVAPGPYVAKVDATTGAQIWRTYLDNANTNNDWIARSDLNTLPNGNVLFSWAREVVVLDGNTGLILKHNNLPTGAGIDSSTARSAIAPDGTAIIRDQTRPHGCTIQSSAAAIGAATCNGTLPNSTLFAVDPNTTRILDKIPMPDAVFTPPTITMYKGKIAIYQSGLNAMYRYFWDPSTEKLSQDTSWIVRDYKGNASGIQTTGNAPGILGNFIVVQVTGAGPSNFPSSIVSISQSDPKNIHSVTPFPLKPGQQSWASPKAAVDVDNNFVLSADQAARGLAGIKVDPNTGNLTVAWTAPDSTIGFQTIIGPKDQRVVVVSNINPNATQAAVNAGDYTEQVIWRNMFTGKLLAASDFTEPVTPNSLITPGYGGRVYYLTDNGFIVYYVTTHPSTNSTSTTSQLVKE